MRVKAVPFTTTSTRRFDHFFSVCVITDVFIVIVPMQGNSTDPVALTIGVFFVRRSKPIHIIHSLTKEIQLNHITKL